MPGGAPPQPPGWMQTQYNELCTKQFDITDMEYIYTSFTAWQVVSKLHNR